MTVNELVDKLVDIEQSLDTGNSNPPLLNEHALKQIRDSLNEVVSDLVHDGIDSNDGFRKVYQGGY